MKKVFLNTLTPEEIIRRLKNGEVIKREDRGNDLIYRMIDGVIVQKDIWDITIGSSFTVDEVDDYYFEEDEPFIITETGVYKTRDGRKAFVYKIKDETDSIYPICYVVEKEDDSILATKQGKYATGETYLDIVAKWEE